MNFLGVGAWELVAILLIMLVFAGPKRMIHWSYVLGQHVAKFRKIWSETVDMVQKEFDEAGVDIKLPKEPPTRKSLNRAVTDAAKPMTQPVQDTLGEVQKDLDAVKDVSDSLNDKNAAAKANSAKKPASTGTRKPSAPKKSAKAAEVAKPVATGAWSAPHASSGPNGNAADLGSWSRISEDGAG